MAPSPQRVLIVHAHPDDESLSTGGLIATLTAEGAHVTVLTCTRGERGEVIPPELAHLAGTAALAEVRERELHDALVALGVRDHRWLGRRDARRSGLEPRVYRDSGMRWGPSGPEPVADPHPDDLCSADAGEAAADIATVILEVRPDVVVSYDEWGGYGHPDHVRVHQIARRAADVMRVAFYAIDEGRSERPATLELELDERAFEAKRRALLAHRTQVVVDGDSFALAHGDRRPIPRVERYRRLRRHPAPGDPRPSAGSTIASALVALVAGALVGAFGTVSHQYAPPLGIVVALGAVTGLIVGLRLVYGTRTVAAAATAGVLAASALFALPGGGGSVLVPDNPLGYVWTVGPVVVALLALGWPRIRPPATT